MVHVNRLYVREAVRAAAACLLWQASDATEDGNGFPIGEDKNGRLTGAGTEYVQMVIDDVPSLTEAVTAFVTDPQNAGWLTADGITAGQAGHDLILTANGHGTGFWDRGTPHGDDLSEACRGYSFSAEFALDADGDVVYLMAENVVITGSDWQPE